MPLNTIKRVCLIVDAFICLGARWVKVGDKKTRQWMVYVVAGSENQMK